MMHWLFGFSYGSLFALVLIENLVLREVLRQTASLKRLVTKVDGVTSWVGLTAGTHAPDFSGPILGTDEMLHASQLSGHASTLFFVSQLDKLSIGEALMSAMHAFWHRSKGHLYPICIGDENWCRNAFLGSHLRVILDKEGTIAKSFGVMDTPQAVELDARVRVKRYGRPDSANTNAVSHEMGSVVQLAE